MGLADPRQNEALRDVKLVIFDVDGTLLDTSEGILSSVDYTLEHYELELPDGFDRMSFIGPPIQNSFAKLYPHLSADEVRQMAATFRDQYKNKDLLKAKLYPGMIETLKGLVECGYALAVATYKRIDYAREIVHHFGIDAYAPIVYGQDMEGKLSKTDVIALCIRDAGVRKEEALMVGDTTSDEKGALEAGCMFLPVTYGFGYKDGYVDGVSGLSVKRPLDILEVLHG